MSPRAEYNESGEPEVGSVEWWLEPVLNEVMGLTWRVEELNRGLAHLVGRLHDIIEHEKQGGGGGGSQ